MKKYGKKMEDVFGFKQTFFEEDQELLKENLYISSIAIKQTERIECKNCATKLNDIEDFVKHNIPYKLCSNCGHLNASYDDTEELARAIYVDEVTDYSKVYSSQTRQEWIERMEKIYLPKAHFLKEILIKEYCEQLPSVTDLGAGSGYFVKALHEEGFDDSIGFEVSNNQVEVSKEMLGSDFVTKIELNELINVVRNTENKVISMIGVLEHLTNPREILKAINDNEKLEYIYLSLPLFSYSVFFEILNENHYNRHLSGGHTHLYSKESIDYLCKEFGFTIVGEW